MREIKNIYDNVACDILDDCGIRQTMSLTELLETIDNFPKSKKEKTIIFLNRIAECDRLYQEYVEKELKIEKKVERIYDRLNDFLRREVYGNE